MLVLYLLLTVYCLFIKKFQRGQGAPVFVEGGACATAQRPVQAWQIKKWQINKSGSVLY